MTAPIFRHPDALDGGLSYIKTNAKTVAIVDYAYVAGDSYATVRGTANANIIVEVALISNDFTLADYDTLGRKLTLAAKSGVASKTSYGVAGNSKVVIFDTTAAKVLSVHNETSGQIFTSGNTVNIPSVINTALQPVQV